MTPNYETHVQMLQHRIDQYQIESGLVKMIDKEILKTTFHFRALRFIRSLIRQRQIIINKERCLKNTSLMLDNISYLKNHITANPYNKDLPAARFFIHSQEKILSLIPGTQPNKRFNDFNKLLTRARFIIKCQTTLNL